MQNLIIVVGVLLVVLIPTLVFYKVEQYQPHLIAHHSHPHHHHPNHPNRPHRHPNRPYYPRHYPGRYRRRYYRYNPMRSYWDILRHHCNKCDQCKLSPYCNESPLKDYHCRNCPKPESIIR